KSGVRRLLFSSCPCDDPAGTDTLFAYTTLFRSSQSVGREIGVGGGVGDGECGQLIDRLAGNGREGWRAVQFIDRDGEGVGGAQRRRDREGDVYGEQVGGSGHMVLRRGAVEGVAGAR